MQLRRRSDDSLLSDAVESFGGWVPDYPEPAIKTVNNVTYLQKRGRMEWTASVTFMFADQLPNSTVDDMYVLIRLVRALEWFTFTDRFGDTYDVRARNVPEPAREGSRHPIFLLDLDLLMEGYE